MKFGKGIKPCFEMKYQQADNRSTLSMKTVLPF